MEVIIFIGIQGSGKTTYYAQEFLKTHCRISLDLLKTRNKEQRFFRLCLDTGQKVVIDNTNPTIASRAGYIEAAKAKKFKVLGYYFDSNLAEAINRNAERTGKELVKEVGIRATYKKLQPPTLAEGFDQLFQLSIVDGEFRQTEIK